MQHKSGLLLVVLALTVMVSAATSSPNGAHAAEGDTIDGRYSGAGALLAGQTATMAVLGRGGVPSANVEAVALNVTVTEPTAASFLTVWPSGADRPLASNMNFVPGQTVANSVFTKVGGDGQIALFNATGAVHVVIDVVGWFATGGVYNSLVPARLADTRDLPTIDGKFRNDGALGQGTTRNITVTGRGGVPAAGVGAVALNVTATNPTLPSYVTVFPTGAERPTASNLNTVHGQTVPNMVIAKVGQGGQVSVYNNSGSVDVVVDVLGWFATGAGFTPMTPQRLLDTRGADPLHVGTERDVPIGGAPAGPPNTAAAAILNVTVVNPSGPGFLTVWPSGSGLPTASNLNFTAGQVVPNLVVAKLGAGGSVALYSTALVTDAVIDVLGWFPAGAAFTGLSPARLMDTRGSHHVASLTPGTSWQWQIDGKTIDETVLDGVTNPKKMYDVDLFATDPSVIARLHRKNITVICYMETGGWESYRPDAGAYPAGVLGNVVSGYPDERFVDIRKTDVLRPILAARLDLAAAKGCDGIEPDLDDTYNGYQTGFALTMDDQLTFNKMVADLAHERMLSVGLKNGASNGGTFETKMEQFTDWALNEQCNQFAECDGYRVYVAHGKAVFQVEYTSEGARAEDVCPADNSANFDGLLKLSSDSLGALPRVACRYG
jgi:hypothetical protein